MLFLLSPAKSLDYDSPIADAPHTRPQFIAQSDALIAVLREKSPQEIASLMSLSDKLAHANDLLALRNEAIDANQQNVADACDSLRKRLLIGAP
ncbi:MAG: peroxide stress protein YaaA, partial [Pseudomonadota bacterium]